MNKKISTPIAIGIILILVILVGGFTWWQYGEIRKEESNVPEVQIPEKKEVKDETVDWETYANEEYGFTFNYSKEWQEYSPAEIPQEAEYMKLFYFIDADKMLKNVESGNYLMTIVFKDSLTLDEWKAEIEKANENEKNYQINIKKLIVGNQGGYQLLMYSERENKKYRAYYIFIKDRICGLSCGGQIDFYNKYCDTILDSFHSI